METVQEFIIKDAKAILLVIHGSGEHIGRYKHFAEWLNSQKISMIGGDLPGLGRSKEKRGHINEFADYLNKVDEWLDYIRSKWTNIPVFLFGHSMGGLVVIRYIEELKSKNIFKGVVVTSPALSIGVKIPEWQLLIAKIMVKVWPTLRLKSSIKAHQVSRDPEVVNRYANDPLVYSKVSIRWFFEFQKAIEEAWQNSDKINQLKTPLLFLQAGSDLLVKPETAKDFVQKLNNEFAEFHLIPDLYHEILNEPEKEVYMKLITDWILEKVED